jgi:hypothetical protein
MYRLVRCFSEIGQNLQMGEIKMLQAFSNPDVAITNETRNKINFDTKNFFK